MNIAIVDDDIQAFTYLQNCLNDFIGPSAASTYFPDGETFLRAWQPGAFDLVFLDIFMHDLTGMDLAREIRKTDANVKLAFCTTSNDFASESYEVGACYYLHKPFGKDQVKAMLDRLDLTEMEALRTVSLPGGTRVRLRSILYADCASHCVTLHCKHGKNIVLRTNFSEISALLCAYPYFFSPTKGVLVNFHEVASQNGSTFQMHDGALIPISRRKTKEVLDAYSSFLFDQLRKGDDL